MQNCKIWIIIFLTIFMSSCVFVRVRRSGRHVRQITVHSGIEREHYMMYRHLKRKARLLGCRKLIVRQVTANMAVGDCIGRRF